MQNFNNKLLSIFSVLLIIFILLACEGEGGGYSKLKNSAHPEKSKEALTPVTIADPQGGTYNFTTRPTITLITDRDAVIYYSTDNETPRPGRGNTISGQTPIEEITFDDNFVLKFFAIDLVDNQEAIKTEEYILDFPPITTPVPSPGGYSQPIAVNLKTNEEEATIYYTIDLSQPTVESDVFDSPILISVEGETTLNFFAVDGNGNIEDIKSASYTIDFTPPVTHPIPPGGIYSDPQSVTITSINEPATIYYSLDGKDPSTLPEDDISQGGNTSHAKNSVTSISIESCTELRFFAVDIVGNREEVRSESYKIGDAPCTTADPGEGNFGGGLEVTLTVFEEDTPVTVYYTLDGKNPTTNSDIYTEPITIDEEGIVTLKYFGVDSKGNVEEVHTLYYTIDNTPPTTNVSPPGGSYSSPQEITLTASEDAVIYYTLDGSDPSLDGQNTFSGRSPLSGIVIAGDGVTLKYIGVDLVGNKETTINSQTYNITVQFVENFNTLDHCDSDTTSGRWDTNNGRIILFRDAPSVVAEYGLNALPIDLVISGDYAFATAGFGGLLVIDVSIPTSPFLVETFDVTITDGMFNAVNVEGTYAYIARSNGLVVLDITDPSKVSRLSEIDEFEGFGCTNCVASDLALLGDYLFLANGLGGVAVIDVSDPKNPSYTGSYTDDDLTNAYGLRLYGKYLYVFDVVDGDIVVFDVTDPSGLTSVSTVSLNAPVGDISMAFFGNHLYAGDAGGDLSVVDISNPADPGIITSAELSLSNNSITDIHIWGNYMFAADLGGEVEIIDLRDPAVPVSITKVEGLGSPTALDMDGRYLFVADSGALPEGPGIRVIEVSVNADLSQEAQLESSDARSLITHGNFAFLADGAGGMVVLDVSNPLSPSKINTISTTNALDLDTRGDLLFLADGEGGLKIFDIKDPSNPAGLDITDDIDDVDGLFIHGYRLYLAAGGGGVKIYNIFNTDKNPDPVFLGELSMSDARDIFVVGDRAVVADGEAGIKYINVADPANPATIGSIDTPGIANAVYARRDYAFLADDTNGFTVFDISDPTIIKTVATTSSTQAKGLTVHGNDLYLADGSGGLKVIDITFPNEPTLLRSLDSTGASSVALYRELAFLTDGEGGLRVIRAGDKKTDYIAPAYAQSTAVDEYTNNIKWARLQVSEELGDYGKTEYQLSNDNGLTWEDVDINDQGGHTFASSGSDLLWSVWISTDDPAFSPIIKQIKIIYKLVQ